LKEPLSLLVVAGHDSSGGAGVEADRECALAHCARVHCVVTAWTVQGPAGLSELGARAAGLWSEEARLALRLRPQALKLGLLPGREHFEAAVGLVREARLRSGNWLPVVFDPVLAPSRGGRFLDAQGVAALRLALGGMGAVLTPNLPELAELAGLDAMAAQELAQDQGARERAARSLLDLGARAVLVKGGHGQEEPLLDLLVVPGEPALALRRPRLAGPGRRGSGCRHATALALGLAAGLPLSEAARRAGEWIARWLAAAPRA
jgi:hydroxymethylpyrimidine/phosphomethylpyrimidine kinase